MSSLAKPEPCVTFSDLHDASPITHVHDESASHSRATSGSSFFDEKLLPLPPKHHPRSVRHARHTFLNVYRRLFGVVFILNIIGLAVLFWRYNGNYSPVFMGHLATAAAANIMVALLIRQDYIVNILFK